MGASRNFRLRGTEQFYPVNVLYPGSVCHVLGRKFFWCTCLSVLERVVVFSREPPASKAAGLPAGGNRKSGKASNGRYEFFPKKALTNWYLNVEHELPYISLSHRLSDSPPWMFLTLFLLNLRVVLGSAIMLISSISSFSYQQNLDPWNLSWTGLGGRLGAMCFGICSVFCNAIESTVSEICSNSLGGQKPSLTM